MTDVQAIAAGGYHSLILKKNGTLFSCGYNNYGQLGDGTLNNKSLPNQITF
jgi:alpha-tubulin suppressor-like RCC1 family protein